MKRVISVLLAIYLVVVVLPVGGYAAEQKEEIIYFDDGSYLVIEINHSQERATWRVTGNKRYTYYSSDGTSLWYAVLTGSFDYTGTSSSCTSSSISVTVQDSAWYVISKSASKSGNKATASVTMGEKVLGVTVARVPVSLTLSCDANGNLS